MSGGGALSADEKRRHTYEMALHVDALLSRLSASLRELVARVNRDAGDDPLDAVRATLDAQLAALAGIEGEAGVLWERAQGVAGALGLRG